MKLSLLMQLLDSGWKGNHDRMVSVIEAQIEEYEKEGEDQSARLLRWKLEVLQGKREASIIVEN
jgi:hypothetical protein